MDSASLGLCGRSICPKRLGSLVGKGVTAFKATVSIILTRRIVFLTPLRSKLLISVSGKPPSLSELTLMIFRLGGLQIL